MTEIKKVESLYDQLIQAWNKQNAADFAALFADKGEIIGFDGSQEHGKEQIYDHVAPIFKDHPTAPFVYIVKTTELLDANTALLRSIAGMVPVGEEDIKPDLNAHQSLLAVREKEQWKVKLFQNTPAQFHGRPELVEEMTNELRSQL
ncbi:SgcJ/EcaC family oxidoreductase [Gracilibacillus caseinilyticus]|uniref:SgcJ/EcaC family oxidoreductase n=1 Tax=Gracilibacillus caseinilyticus TaxID=2932256 RepID=A0ABY4EYH4_9BACI|nr:SgcJ/EcaC family oxidoreductase [Gracilibacillus caseinilyticus]UOQ49318.1 SgcJ/EcaC family oxidoreductase [Gracilibacillus caseinilyticus]